MIDKQTNGTDSGHLLVRLDHRILIPNIMVPRSSQPHSLHRARDLFRGNSQTFGCSDKRLLSTHRHSVDHGGKDIMLVLVLPILINPLLASAGDPSNTSSICQTCPNASPGSHNLIDNPRSEGRRDADCCRSVDGLCHTLDGVNVTSAAKIIRAEMGFIRNEMLTSDGLSL